MNFNMELRNAIGRAYNIEELHDLCFDMDIEYENLGGERKNGKIRELLEHCRANNRYPDLVQMLKQTKRGTDWTPFEQHPIIKEQLRQKEIESRAETKGDFDDDANIDLHAENLVYQQLNPDSDLPEEAALKEAVQEASHGMRRHIFVTTRVVRTENWSTNIALMERTIPIFEALVDNNDGEINHRYYGQLGYALKDQGVKNGKKSNWVDAYRALSKAINLRDMAGEDGRLMYEFNRALCGIYLNKPPDTITQDLFAAAKRKSLLNRLQLRIEVKKWAASNDFDLSSLGKKKKKSAAQPARK